MNVKIIAVVVVILLGLIGIGILGNDNPTSTTPETVNTVENSEGTDTYGVELVEALDFECPACASFHPILLQVKEEYRDRVKFTVKHFPLTSIHPNAFAGHRAAQAAANQGKFKEMHDLLFEQRGLWTTQATSNPVEQLEAFAEQIGLDMDKYRQDFASSEVNDYINTDIAEMRKLGAEATPTFYLNGERVLNSELDSVAKFSAVLDNALADAGYTDPSSEADTVNSEASKQEDSPAQADE